MLAGYSENASLRRLANIHRARLLPLSQFENPRQAFNLYPSLS